jgi:3-isopropylmalate dehydrogenase
MKAHIVTLPGDGIGPEVTSAVTQVLEAVGNAYGHQFEFSEYLIGGCAIEAAGVPLEDATLTACKEADAVLLGAVGGPQWDDPTAPVRPEQGLLALRSGLKLFANLRPVRSYPDLFTASPLKSELLEGVDILIVRELTGGIYFGKPRGRDKSSDGHVRAVDSLVYWDYEVERVARLAFRLAVDRSKKVTSVDKANVLESSRLWRQTVTQQAEYFPGVTLDHQLVDAAAMRLMTQPSSFDVILTTNMFGDILADEASVISGSLGLLPSASLGDGRAGLYEPIHGSAPDIAGRGIANPLGAILSGAMLLRHSLGLEDEAQAVEQAVSDALLAGCRTADLTTEASLTTAEMTTAVIARLSVPV